MEPLLDQQLDSCALPPLPMASAEKLQPDEVSGGRITYPIPSLLCAKFLL